MIVSIRAHPNSGAIRILWKNRVLHVYLTEPAEKNRANKQLIRLLTREFGSCRILKGASSRSKKADLPIALKGLKNYQ